MSEITKIQRELYVLKMQNAQGATKQTHKIKLLKKQLARAQSSLNSQN